MKPWGFLRRGMRQRLSRFRRSMWFIPMLMSLGAVGLFVLTSWADQRLGGLDPGELTAWGRLLLFAGSADAAQTQLATISGMWATIIGISFSVTLVTVQLTATKYIAQVLPLFERNKTNQVVLGTYLLTVTYAMLVSRTVRSAAPVFVPYVGINVAMLLAIVSIFLLILFVSNVVNFVRPQFFLGKTLRDAHHALRKARRRVEPTLWTPAAEDALPAGPPRGAADVRTLRHGVLTDVAWAELAEAARAHLRQAAGPGTWQVFLARMPGDPVVEDEVLAHVVAPEGGDPAWLAALVGWACEVRSEAQPLDNAESAIEALAGLTTKGAVQGDLDVTFAGVDCLFSLLPLLARLPTAPACLRLEVDDRLLLIRVPRQDLLAKLVRELTVVSEVALAPSLPFRLVTEGISARFVAALRALAREDDASAFERVLAEIGPWYESAFFHMGWVNGMHHLADDLAALAVWTRHAGPPGSFEAVQALLRTNRERLAPDAQAREALDAALTAIAKEVGQRPLVRGDGVDKPRR